MSEYILGGMACLPNALIDALDYLGRKLSQKDQFSLQRQRRNQLVFLSEELSPGGHYADKAEDHRFIASYELNMAQNMVEPFGCIITSATLWTVAEFLERTSSQERVLAKVLEPAGSNHIEHVRTVDTDQNIQGNSHTYTEPVFMQMVQSRQEMAGFNALCIRSQ